MGICPVLFRRNACSRASFLTLDSSPDPMAVSSVSDRGRHDVSGWMVYRGQNIQ